jgi:hypothetical protein
MSGNPLSFIATLVGAGSALSRREDVKSQSVLNLSKWLKRYRCASEFLEIFFKRAPVGRGSS